MLRRRYCVIARGGSRTIVFYRALCCVTCVCLTLFLDKRFLILGDSLCLNSLALCWHL